MSDLQISDDMKMENYNIYVRMQRKVSRYSIDKITSSEMNEKISNIVLEELLIINNYGAFLYNNDLVANKEDIFDDLTNTLEKERAQKLIEEKRFSDLEEFENNHL